MNTIATIVQFLILFVGGFNASQPDWRWAQAFQVAHGVFIDDALLMLYLLAMAISGRIVMIRTNHRALLYALMIALLAGVGILSAGVNGHALTDFGEALRVLLLAAYFLLAVHWSAARRDPVVLRVFLLGIAAGGLVNLYSVFTDPLDVVGSMPVLRARNGAGGPLALGVSLGAWLMLQRRSRRDVGTALFAAIVGTIGAALSFSRTAMLIAACGLGAWLWVLAGALATRHLRRVGVAAITVLLAAGVYAAQSQTARDIGFGVVRSIQVKFGYLDLNDKRSLGGRYMYFFGVGELLVEHPLLGVSYSGFYDAITSTALYRSGVMGDEDPDTGRAGYSNPHNSFLYYAAANGLPGLTLVVMLFVVFVRALWVSLARDGTVGRVVCIGVGLAYFVYGMTLPSMFNTEVLFLSAATAMGLAVRQPVSLVRPAQAALHSVQASA
ncbi:MAG: O-antigen ligase family protein [Acidobacteriota bacterium]|nr:O-antigen ligase family protein [Acidobacteriota bacterium]